MSPQPNIVPGTPLRQGAGAAVTTSFESSLVPMLIADDDRRYVDANAAACLLLRLSPQRVLQLRIDDLTPAEARPAVDQMWRQFLADGVQSGSYALAMPDGGVVRVEYSATANIAPGRHLSILIPLYEDAAPGDTGRAETGELGLTARELEVLGLVAMGESSSSIAAELGISTAIVDTHVRNCLEKLGARNRAHAIAIALQRGAIQMTGTTGAREAVVAG